MDKLQFLIFIPLMAGSRCYFKSRFALPGSASPVLTATGFVNERRQFLTPPTESTPLDRSPKNLLLVISRRPAITMPNLVQIRPWGASVRMGEI